MGGEEEDEDDEGGGWGDDDDLDDALGDLPTPKRSTGGYMAPTKGTAPARRWSQQSNAIADLVSAGSFELAASNLKQDLGIVALAPLKPQFISLQMGSHCAVPSLSPMPAKFQAMQRNYKASSESSGLPLNAITIENLSVQIKGGYTAFTKGKFDDAHAIFLKVLQSIPFVVCDTLPALNELKKLMTICREYVTGLCIEKKRKATTDKKAQTELAAYFTHVNLEPMHLCLTLRQAMSMNVKLKNFALASSFARRLLELNPSAKFAADARKVVAAAEQNNTNQVELSYDEKNPFTVCAESFVPLYRGTPTAKCGYCGASYAVQYKGNVCSVCQIGEIGLDVPGLQVTGHD